MKQLFVPKRFNAASLDIIEKAEAICREYQAQGFILTLRQLYYQFVARGYLPNVGTEYKRLGAIINDARLAGKLDWDYLEDRTRNLQGNVHWSSPAEIIDAAARSYQNALWRNQQHWPEVWVEKEALAGVVERTARALDVSYFSCRGYVSQSEMYVAAMRLKGHERQLQRPVIIHLGDHDPSGIDMTRDIRARLLTFGCYAEVKRIALNMDQVEEFNPPPNPAKLSDSRCADYVAEYGDESWELDALDPRTLDQLIRDTVLPLRDAAQWNIDLQKQERSRHHLTVLKENWDNIPDYLDREYGSYNYVEEHEGDEEEEE